MEVSDDKKNWYKKIAVSEINGRVQTKAEDGYGIASNWKFAREIEPQVTEPSQQEIKNQLIELGNKMSELTKKLK